jgi:hypothetical protein
MSEYATITTSSASPSRRNSIWDALAVLLIGGNIIPCLPVSR